MKSILYFFISLITAASILLFSYYFTLKTDFDGSFKRWYVFQTVKLSKNSNHDISVEIDSAGIIKYKDNSLMQFWEASVNPRDIERLKTISEKNDIFFIYSQNPSEIYKARNSTRISIVTDNGKENSFSFSNISSTSKQMSEINREIRRLIKNYKPI